MLDPIVSRRTFLVAALMGTAALAGCASTGDEDAADSQGSQDSLTNEPTEETPTAEEETEAEVTKHSLGETVETDLMRLTLNKAQFAIVLDSSVSTTWASFKGNTPYGSNFGDDMPYFAPKDYVEEEDAGTAYLASKGHVLVFYEFTAENLDRSVLIVGGIGRESFVESITYSDTTYSSDDFEEEKYGVEADLEGNWEALGTDNFGISAASTSIYRAYIDLPMEPASLEDPFEIAFNLPKSDGTSEPFFYRVG